MKKVSLECWNQAKGLSAKLFRKASKRSMREFVRRVSRHSGRLITMDNEKDHHVGPYDEPQSHRALTVKSEKLIIWSIQLESYLKAKRQYRLKIKNIYLARIAWMRLLLAQCLDTGHEFL